jgi:transketolase
VTEAEPNRIAYAKALAELGEVNLRIVVLDADVSKSTNTFRFESRFPNRFFNVGVAEQNMICIAAGLATTGWIPFANTFAVFASMRACEQVRTSVAYPHLNVKIVGVNAGVEIAGDGVTHQAVEDLAIMRSLPNMMVLSPSDPVTTRRATAAIAEYDGPVYMRLGRQASNVIHPEGVEFKLGKMIRMRDGDDVTLLATGNMVEQSLKAAEELARRGISARVLDCHTVKPIDRKEILLAARETAGIVTAEDHNIVGGLGSAVCEILAEECPATVKRVGLRDIFARSGRDYRQLLSLYQIDASEIGRKAEEVLSQRPCLAQNKR